MIQKREKNKLVPLITIFILLVATLFFVINFNKKVYFSEPLECIPENCSSLDKQCGSWNDGCGGTLDCDRSFGCVIPTGICDFRGKCVENLNLTINSFFNITHQYINTNPGNVSLNLTTFGGANEGIANCFVALGRGEYVEFNQTNSTSHFHILSLEPRNIAVGIKCIDIWQNEALLGFSMNVLFSCIPNWTQYNTTCSVSDEFISYYLDSKNCNDSSGIPANITNICDYDDNRIIGNISNFKNRNSEFDLFEGTSSLNDSGKNFIGVKNLKIKRNNTFVVEFSYNFSVASLNLNNIFIKSQDSNYNYGYLIVNGIDADKKFIVDRINKSDMVCIEDKEITSISSVSSGCNSSGEILLNCPGNTSKYNCTIVNNTYVVTGLSHSAVKEYSAFSSSSDDDLSGSSSNTCIPLWECSWSSCSNNIQTCTYVDSRNCGTLVDKPDSTTRACETTSVPITPVNLINDEDSSASMGKSTFFFWFFVIILIVLILIVGIVILKSLIENRESKNPFPDKPKMIRRF